MSEPVAPYGPEVLRLCSVTLKSVTVKKEPAIRITVKWEQLTEEGWDKHQYGSTRDARSAFWNKINDLAPFVLQMQGLSRDLGPTVTEVKQTYDDEDNMIATLKAGLPGPFGSGILETPAVAQSGGYEVLQPPEYTAALEAFGKEALAYATGVAWDLFSQPAVEAAAPE